MRPIYLYYVTPIIINMLRQSSHSKQLFYKGITLKDYLRKSAVLIVENDKDETLLVDEFNHPLLNIDDVSYWHQNIQQNSKTEVKQLSTKVSTAKSIDQDQQLPPLQIRKPIPNIHKTKNYYLNCPNSDIRGCPIKNNQQSHLLDLTKSKDLKLQKIQPEHVTKRPKMIRQKCLATRQVSRQSQDSCSQYKKKQHRGMSYRQYVQQVKKEIQQRRDLSLKKSDKWMSKARKVHVLGRSATQQN